MITVTQSRDGHSLPSISFAASLAALTHLIDKEVQFGGKVTAVASDMLEVETTVLGCVDVTQFQGPTDLMAPLVKFGRLHQEGEPTEIAVLKACGFPAIKPNIEAVSRQRPIDIIAAAQLAENGQQFRELMRA